MVMHSDLGNFSRLNTKVITHVYPSKEKKTYIFTDDLRDFLQGSHCDVLSGFFLALKMGGDHGPVTFMFGPQSRLV